VDEIEPGIFNIKRNSRFEVRFVGGFFHCEKAGEVGCLDRSRGDRSVWARMDGGEGGDAELVALPDFMDLSCLSWRACMTRSRLVAEFSPTSRLGCFFG